MHEAEEGEHRARQSKGRSLRELLLDHEHTDGAEHETGQDRSAAENLEPVIEHAHLAELVETDCCGTGPRCAKRAVHQGLAPSCKMRGEREHNRRRVLGRRGLERLRPDEHADVEQDGRYRDHRDKR